MPVRIFVPGFLLLITATLLTSCTNETAETDGNKQVVAQSSETDISQPLQPEEIVYQPLKQSTREATGQFVEVPSEVSGVDFSNQWPEEFHRELPGSFITAGIAAGDFNDDGLVDFFAARRIDGGRLFQNLGEMKFEDVTEARGLNLEGLWGTGATFVDINNDGRLDLVVCGFDSPNRVFINLGDRFEDRANELQLDYRGPSVVMTFSDYDRDGDLDAYLLTNQSHGYPNPEFKPRFDDNGRPIVAREYGEMLYFVLHPDGRHLRERAGRFDHLFRNDGDKFVDVTREVGFSNRPFFGLSATWWDYNDDGWPDLFVSNDFKGPDHLYRNNGPGQDGVVTFTDVARTAFPHTPWFSMGSDIADINNDGRMDLIATDMAGTNHYRDKLSMGPMSGPNSRAWFLNVPRPPQYMRNCLYLNTGTPHFMEAAYLTGLALTDWTWTARFADFDHDGLQDIYFTNGMSRDWFNGDRIAKAKWFHDQAGGGKRGRAEGYQYWYLTPRYELENLAFRNTGNLNFDNVSSDWGLDHHGVSTGGATADFDGDGDLDIVINGFDEPLKVYRNDVARGNCVKIVLAGTSSNRRGLGSRIVVETVDEAGAATTQLRYLNSNQGIMSGSEPVAHFGLGDALRIARVEVTWPSGIVQELSDINANHVVKITEPDETISFTDTPGPDPNYLFRRTKQVLPAAARHEELPFDDFKVQPLIPNQYSQLGPGMSWGDLDGDGDQDCFVGGGRGSFAKVLINNQGRLEISKQLGFDEDRQAEDMGSLIFDADSDGDLDIYVVSGSSEFPDRKELLQDRLYLNDGTGIFAPVTNNWLPEIVSSGSCVAGADYDRDGDVDLFVGGRIVPGEYPTSPRSFLLANDGVRLNDVTESVAADLARAGMATSAVWSDVNSDGWVDLLVSYEWGPIRLFLNRDGKQLSDATEVAGLDRYSGWFNSVSTGDVDNDGDVDLVVGNFGLNTKYHATDEKPELLFYGEFDGSGKKHIVEAKYEDGRCVPRRGLGCSSDAMPMVREKLPTFHEFAISPLEDIYTSELIEKAERFAVNSLESMVVINETANGNVSFRFQPLPRIAQISPIFGSALVDLNGDGNLDLIVAQNFHGPQRETGFMDGGLSMAFLGLGDGTFDVLWPDQSGIAVPGDATCLTVMDLNRDQRPDFVIGVNDDFPVHFENCSKAEARKIRLVGPESNVNAIGSRVKIKYADGRLQAFDVNSGGSYLSQSPAEIFVSADSAIESINVIWSDGRRDSISSPQFPDNVLEIDAKSFQGPDN